MRPYEHDWTELDRRRFLQLMGASAVVAAGAKAGLGRDLLESPAAAATTSTASVAPVAAPRTLVALDCAGGLDGPSMLVPLSGAYASARAEAAIDQSSLLSLDSEVGVHPSLAKLHARGAAWIQGVGIPNYDLSHFESLRRWWAGDMVDGTPPLPGGFLARVCDAIGDSSVPAVGVTVGFGPTAAFAGSAVATVPCDPYGPLALPIPHPGINSFDDAFRNAYAAASIANGSDSSMLASARQGSRNLLGFLNLLANLPDDSAPYPNTSLGTQLRLAAQLLGENAGVRVIHVPVYNDFDTHKDHVLRCAAFLTDIDDALDAFLTDIAARGLVDSVLVVQYSEFGRRGTGNDSAGLDHGAASVAFMAGPVNPGRYGSYPSFASLDGENNLTPTVTMAEYYGTIAEGWFGVPASSVLTGSPQPITGIVS